MTSMPKLAEPQHIVASGYCRRYRFSRRSGRGDDYWHVLAVDGGFLAQ
jgi:hypothetical protein